jgi:hypothetical protein
MRPISLVAWLTALSFMLLLTNSFAQSDVSVSHTLFKPSHISTSANTPMDPWERATSLGGIVRTYIEDLLHKADAPNPAIAENIASFKAAIQNVVASAGRFKNEVRETIEACGGTLEGFSDELAVSFMSILKDLEAEFPPHDQSPSHKERVMMTANVMTKAEEYAVKLGRKNDISEASIRTHFGDLRLHIEPLIVITGKLVGNSNRVKCRRCFDIAAGDLVEQHPVLLDVLLFSASVMVIPEAWLLRPLLSLFGFGPYGPVKGGIGLVSASRLCSHP